MAPAVRDRKALLRTGAALGLLLVLSVINVFWGHGKVFWVNMSGSEPIGLYRLQDFTGQLTRGELVFLEVPQDFKRYLHETQGMPAGWSLIKGVGGVPGDVYCITDEAFYVNGVLQGPIYQADRQGRPLPSWRGCREIPPGHFLPVATRIRRSFDGRYMGPVPISLIKGVAHPVWTF